MLSVAISIVTPSFPRAPAFYVRWSNDHCSLLAGSDVQITRHGRKHTHEPTARKPGAPPKHFDHGSHLELSEYQLARRMQDVKLCLQPPVPPNGQGRGKHPLPLCLIRSTRPPPKWPGQRQTPPSPRPKSFNPLSPQRARAEASPPSPLNPPSPQMARAGGRTSSPGAGCSTPPPPKWPGQKQTPLPPGRQEPTHPRKSGRQQPTRNVERTRKGGMLIQVFAK